MSKKIVIANWKANPDDARKAVALGAEIERETARYRTVNIVIAPPFPFLADVGAVLKKTSLGSQDAFWDSGPYTGAVSPAQLQSVGVRYAIVGHSERRIHMQETDAMVQKKLHAVLASGMSAIFCVGERERQDADVSATVGEQLRTALAGSRKEWLCRLIIAYEPVWAISSTEGSIGAADPNAIFRTRLYIEKIVTGLFGARTAQEVRIIYGGSADAKNTQSLIAEGKMDGLLVGRASLDPQMFSAVAASVASVV